MKRLVPYFFFVAIGVAVILFFGLVYFQYLIWRDGGQLTRYLIPPYQSIWYLFSYVIGHKAYSYIVSLGISFVFLGISILLNEIFEKKFFEEEEPYWGALGIFVLGTPWWLYYLVTVLLLGIIGSLVFVFWLKKCKRFSLYYLWPSTMVVFFLFQNFCFSCYNLIK